MGSRFFITGVQIGMLKAFAMEESESQALKLLDEIMDKQYICEDKDFNKMIKEAKLKNK